jgi:L-aspartate oxidase
MSRKRESKVDFLILGGGIAGTRAAIGLASAGKVLVLTKGELYESSTEYAQGGIAAALGEDDEVGLHLHDTLLAGDGLCREKAVQILVNEGPEEIEQLIAWGMRFDRNGNKLAFTREGAHSRSRVLHAHGDSTGSEILRALMAKAKFERPIQFLPRAFAVDLLVDANRVCGVTFLDEKTSALKTQYANAVLLATGGLGQVYGETTNPLIATGDGVAMAHRAGALSSDMEFVQFHPTALYVKKAPRFLLSEALRGEGAYLRNILLERFMPRYHEAAELAPRDIVSRALIMEMQKTRGECVYLDLTELDPKHVKKRFPRIYSTCLQYNIDITADLVPIRPAAHYAMGGVATDLHGATSLKGLYAAGEVAATGVHGANRLASNSLLEGLVFGARAASAMIDQRREFKPPLPRQAPNPVAGRAPSGPELNTQDSEPAHLSPQETAHEVRSILWDKVGIIRTGKDLCDALKRLDSVVLVGPATPSRQFCEARNLLQVGRIITRCALARQESRGAHYRSDFPLKDEAASAKHSFAAKQGPVFFA